MRKPHNTALAAISVFCMLTFLAGCEEEEEALKPIHIPPPGAADKPLSTKVGIHAFPPDLTVESIQGMREIVRNYGDLSVVQLDNGIPWQEALRQADYPAKVMEEWQNYKAAMAPGQTVYLAFAPLQDDRISWATGHEGAAAPKWVRHSKTLTPEIGEAYGNYVLRAVEYFRPRYINLGMEAGDLAQKDPQRWPEFVKLYRQTSRKVLSRFPDAQVGISSSLPLMMEPEVLARQTEIFHESDYVGISFYPHLGQFYEKIGGSPLSSPPHQWRTPLNWLSQNIALPIAICETGYSSSRVISKRWGLNMPASEDLQAEFIRDLADIAAEQNFLFVAFFLAVDYDRLAEKISDPGDILPLWQHTGFFDKDFQPKAAWEVYQESWLGLRDPWSGRPAISNPPQGVSATTIAFRSAADLFQAPESGSIQLIRDAQQQPVMRWEFAYQGNTWAWAHKTLSQSIPPQTQQLQFRLRSDRELPLILQLEENSGETHFAILSPTREWQMFSLAAKDFQVDPAKRKDGGLQWEEVNGLLLADGNAEEKPMAGQRLIELTEIHVNTEEMTP